MKHEVWHPTRVDWITGIATAVATLVVYILTLAPTVTEGDSGALITVMHTMGIAHPPGYPLYVLLGKLFTWLPVGSIAWRVNLASAVFGAAAAFMVFLTVLRLTRDRWAGLLSAGLFAFSPLVWRYSVVTEVFSLNNLLVATIMYVALLYHENKKQRTLWLLALLSGLAVSHHQTSLFVIAPVWLWLATVNKQMIVTTRTLGKCALFFVLGLTPFLYLPIVSFFDPHVAWGGELATREGFLRHVFRADYGTLNLLPGMTGTVADFNRVVFLYLGHLPRQMLVAGALLAVWGLYHAVRAFGRDRGVPGFVVAVGVAAVLYVIGFHALARLPLSEVSYLATHVKKFWLLPNLLICVAAGYGIHVLAAQRPQLRMVVMVVAIVGVAAQFGLNYRAQDQSDNWLLYKDAMIKLEKLPADAILLTVGDNHNNTLQYIHECEDARPDVVVLSLDFLGRPYYTPIVRKHFDVTLPADVYVPAPKPIKGRFPVTSQGRNLGNRLVYSLSYFFDENIDRRPIYLTNFLLQPAYAQERSWQDEYDLALLGTLLKVVRVDNRPTFDEIVAEAPNYLPDLDDIAGTRYEKDTWEDYIWASYWVDYHKMFLALNATFPTTGGSNASLTRTATLLESFAENYPEGAPGLVYWELGLLYAFMSERDPAARDRLDALWGEHLNGVQPPTSLHAERVRAVLDAPDDG